MLEDIKLALRITHDKIDNDLEQMEKTVKSDLLRAGAKPEVIVDENPLVRRIIIIYCKRELTSSVEKRDRFHQAYEQMLDEIRKSGDSYIR